MRLLATTFGLAIPSAILGQTASIQELSNGYTILSMGNDGEALVADKGSNFVCTLSDQKEFIGLVNCRPILTAKQSQSRAERKTLDEIVARFENVTQESDKASFLALFPRPSCDLYVGGFDQLDQSELTATPPTPTDGAPPLEVGLPSFKDVETRSALIRDFGMGIGFTREEVELLVERLDARVNWTVKTLLEEGVLAKVSPRVLKMQTGCN